MEKPSPRQAKVKAKPTQSKHSKAQQPQLKAADKSDSDIWTEPVIDTAPNKDVTITILTMLRMKE